MSLRQVEKSIHEFLSRDGLFSTLVLSGEWGVGKTHLVKSAFEKLTDGADKKIRYVSCFGLNSLNELKNSIALSQVVTNKTEGLSVSKLLNQLQSAGPLLEKLTVASAGLSIALPENVFSNLMFNSLSKQIICIDDLERAGGELKPKDVLGLISFLKEEKDCKVLLLVNDHQLNSDEFEQKYEKVFDQRLRLEPTSKEAAKVAGKIFDENADADFQKIGDICDVLRVSNIRLMHHMYRNFAAYKEAVEKLGCELPSDSLPTICAYIWVKYGENSPTELFFRSYSAFAHGFGEEDVPEDERIWQEKLQNMDYGHTSELDIEICNFVDRGYLVAEPTRTLIADIDKQIKREDARKEINQAWNLCYNSFEDNLEKVLGGILDVFNTNIEYLTGRELDITVEIIESIGRNDDAKALIDQFIENHKENPEHFSPKNTMRGAFKTQSVNEALSAAYSYYSKNPLSELSLIEILSDGDRVWSADAEALLPRYSPDDIVNELMKGSGKDFTEAMRNVQDMRRTHGIGELRAAFVKSFSQAMKQIAKSSDLNKYRAEWWGFKLDKKP